VSFIFIRLMHFVKSDYKKWK